MYVKRYICTDGIGSWCALCIAALESAAGSSSHTSVMTVRTCTYWPHGSLAITKALTYIYVTSCPTIQNSSICIYSHIHSPIKNQHAYQPYLRSIFARNKQSRKSRNLERLEMSWADYWWPRSCPVQILAHKQWCGNLELRSCHVSGTQNSVNLNVRTVPIDKFLRRCTTRSTRCTSNSTMQWEILQAKKPWREQTRPKYSMRLSW